MNYPSDMDFFDVLDKLNIDAYTFGLLLLTFLITFYIIYRIPFVLITIFTLFLVLFGNWNDIKRDKFLWHRDNYLYRKVECLYDDKGYCVKSIYYKYIQNHKLNKEGKK